MLVGRVVSRGASWPREAFEVASAGPFSSRIASPALNEWPEGGTLVRSRIVLCLGLVAALSGCRVFSMTTGQALAKFSGYENELRVRAVASVDKAWLIPGKGLVFLGEVMPGRFVGDGIRINPYDEPPRAPFVAGLSLKEIASRRPWLHAERFHRVKDNDVWCVETYFRGERVQTKVVEPNGASLWALKLEDQVIVVRSDKGIELRDSVRLGPRSGDWLYLLALPVTLVGDLARLALSGPEPVLDDCKALELVLFPPESSEPALEARTEVGRPRVVPEPPEVSAVGSRPPGTAPR